MTPTTIRKKRRAQFRGRNVDPTALSEVRALLDDMPRRRDLLIEYLHRIQDRYGFLSGQHLVALAHELAMASTEVYEVATFYHHFDVINEDQQAPAALTVRVCDSITCEMMGAHALVAALERGLGNVERTLNNRAT